MLKNALMVQGTTSDSGKSTFVTGLCRALANRAIRVCPFKPQNMSLNSAVTPEGGEIGRAQALQAEAAKIPTHSDMNPVLLKPSSDIAAQVIIHGKSINVMDAAIYQDYKAVARNAVLESFERLQSQFEFVAVEGAGSPAEINLREGDIANMGFAEAVDCPVILIADIDKGGVFAHLVGTLELLSQSEQDRVIGFVINKFRGDIELLKPGLDWLEARTHKPVLGVLPYLHNLQLDAEDAIASEQQLEKPLISIAVIVLPHTSNHTDFDALRYHPEIDLKFVRATDGRPECDVIILPGSKNTRADLEYLKEHDWQEKLQAHLRYGGRVIGICGGFQMLGKGVSDPHGIESNPGESQGFGFIPMHTELEAEKILENVELDLSLHDARASVSAYEIHCGISTFSEDVIQPFMNEHRHRSGFLSHDQHILGSYYHGLFDTSEALALIGKWAGGKLSNNTDLQDLREASIERLTQALENSVDVDALLQRIDFHYSASSSEGAPDTSESQL